MLTKGVGQARRTETKRSGIRPGGSDIRVRATHRAERLRTRATWLRRAQLAGAALLALGAPLALLAGRASAATLVSGSVTLTTIGTVASGTPYSSGQLINISVAANITLSLANLETAGYTGEPAMKAVECDDPGGLVANLPATPTGHCDGQTILSTSAVNADGSFALSNYTIYALPNDITFSESPTSTPACGIGADQCVLYLGPNQNDFSKPHLFSAPFSVAANVDDGGENPGDGSTPAQTMTSAGKSTVVASPATAVADGANIAKVTVTLEDTNGAPVTGGKQVTLSGSSGTSSTIMYNGSAGSTGTTNSTTGAVSFTVSDTKAEAVTYTATDVTDSDLLLAPTAGNPTVTFIVPAVTPANSTITAVPTTVPSGTSTAITVTLEDQAVPPVPVAGKVVTLAQGTGRSTITTVSGTTNAQGQATFTATDTTAEAVTYTASAGGAPLTGVSAVVTFGTLTVSSTASTVTANPTVVSTLSSGGVLPTGTVTVTLVAPDGHSDVSGKTVTLAASSTNAVITTVTGTTGSNGQATFTVADGTAEDVMFTATDFTDSALVITQKATVDFETPAPAATASTVTTSTTSGPADGVTPATIVVTMLDQFGHALPGVALTVTGNPSTTTRVAPATESTSVTAGTTDVNGQATFDAYDTTAETVTYSAMDTTDNLALTQTVNVAFLATAPQADTSTVTAVPNDVAADGKTSSTVTVTLDDHNSNPVPGKAITLAAAGGSSVITPISPTTNAEGKATLGVTDTTSEVVMYTATDTIDGLVLAGQGVTVTFGTPPPVAPAIADSTVVADPSQVPADGSTGATITVVLADTNGDALSSKTVSLNPQGGSSSVTTVTGTTDSDGEATFTVTDKTAETVTYDATDVTDNLPITGQSTTVVFTTATGSSGAGGSGSTTSTTTSTTPLTSATSAPGSTSATTTVATAADAAATGNTGSSDSSATPASAISGGSLAFTGASDLLPWMLALGCILLGFGTIGRRRLTRRQPVVVRIGSDSQ